MCILSLISPAPYLDMTKSLIPPHLTAIQPAKPINTRFSAMLVYQSAKALLSYRQALAAATQLQTDNPKHMGR